MVGRSRVWAEKQLEAAHKEVVDLGPAVMQNQKESLALAVAAFLLFFVSIPFPHPRDYVLLGVSWVFFITHAIWHLRGSRKKADFEHARWKVEVYDLALKIAHSIAYEEQLLQAGEPVEEEGTDGSASL
jgi:hypothetical protein